VGRLCCSGQWCGGVVRCCASKVRGKLACEHSSLKGCACEQCACRCQVAHHTAELLLIMIHGLVVRISGSFTCRQHPGTNAGRCGSLTHHQQINEHVASSHYVLLAFGMLDGMLIALTNTRNECSGQQNRCACLTKSIAALRQHAAMTFLLYDLAAISCASCSKQLSATLCACCPVLAGRLRCVGRHFSQHGAPRCEPWLGRAADCWYLCKLKDLNIMLMTICNWRCSCCCRH